MTNVIVFPKAKRNNVPQSIEEIIEKVSENRKEYIDYIVEDSMSYFLTRAFNEGFDFSEEIMMKQIYYTAEAMKALLCRTEGIEHPLHEVADCLEDVAESGIGFIEE